MKEKHVRKAGERGRGRWWSLGLVMIGAAAAAGCGGTPFELTQATLEDHRARWLRAGIVDYRYEHVRRCECLAAITQPAVVEVRRGLVTSVVYAGTGEPAGATEQRFFPTVEDLFEVIDDAIRQRAASLVVSYHESLGYPTSISIDYDTQVADDEFSIDATGLAPL
ncbi:MAG: DUF6174 domain-containing protein [Gemmatimonadota bacterium]|nr:DUF6174 domain-containing protein [Gemmatimonadota bacterium]